MEKFEKKQSSPKEKLITHWINKLIPVFEDCQTINDAIEQKIDQALKEFDNKNYPFSRADLLYFTLHELKERNSYLLPKLESIFISSAEELISQKIAKEWDSDDNDDFYELLKKNSRQLSKGLKINSRQIKSRVIEIKNK
ncbi:MAG: hypothetical protein KAS12_06545 [Candidatus Aenigmarchaeota archaeon]|nr:hypothetical protein [Candidatus Aenigmarchaeota archaeon]